MTAGDLTTLANVKAYLSPPLTATANDVLLARLVTAASQFIQTWLGQAVALADYSETRNGPGGTRLFLRHRPVAGVAAVSVDGVAIPAAATSTAAGYLFDDSSVYLNGFAFARGRQNVSVSYSAGYAATPPELEQACIALVALRYKERDRIGQASKNLGGETVAFSQKDMPADVASILDPYRSVAPA
jgi:uncharacterized phiE125 gp8 family phage protein